MGILGLIVNHDLFFGCLVIFLYDVSSSYWSIVVSKVSWHSLVLLGQLARCLHFTLHCPSSWMWSGFFFTVVSVLPKNKWMALLDFHLSFCCTEVSVFCYESCQCIPNYGFWNILNSADLEVLLTKVLLCMLLRRISLLSLRNIHKVSVMLDSNRNVFL